MSVLAPVLLQCASAAADRYALVSIEAASAEGQILLRLATGAERGALLGGTAYGPFPAAEAEARQAHLLERLRAAGYTELGPQAELIAALSGSRAQRARAAIALGWRADPSAVAALLEAATQATSELPSLVEALGRSGDPRAIPLCREQASKKLLSRRRAGVEALRRLGDSEGLAAARIAGLERLPEALREQLAQFDEQRPRRDQVEALQAAVLALEPAKRGLVIDQFYEFASPLCLQVARRCLREGWDAPHVWRYTKSVWKRAMVREDVGTFAQLALAFERRRGRTRGERQPLKSGLDGQTRPTPVFCARTQAWVCRASARWLRRLAYWRPACYPVAAAAVLRRYDATDARAPDGLLGPFSHALMLHQLLHAAGPRQRVDARARVRARRSEALLQVWQPEHVPFAARWQAHPALLELAAFAQLDEVRAWGGQGLRAHPALIEQADPACLAALCAAEPELEALARAELLRRFQPQQPDLRLCAALLDGGDNARRLGLDLLHASAAYWIGGEQIVRLLRRRNAAGRDAAATAVRSALPLLDTAARSSLLRRLLESLDGSTAQAEPERQSAVIDVLLAHAREAARERSLEQVLAWVQDGDLARRSVGGALLGEHADALTLIGNARLVVLADDEVQSVRAAACSLVARALDALRSDPWPLLQLAETRFPDTRRCAFELLQQLDIATLGLDALVGLCDSNHVQVQAFARDWIRAHLDRLAAQALLERLVEHPHAAMRAFALELLEQHLPPGAAALAGVQAFLRVSLLTPRLPRAARDRLLRVTEARGLCDPQQAAIAVNVLGAALRTQVQRDFEPLVLALSRIQLRFPQLESDWTLLAEGGA